MRKVSFLPLLLWVFSLFYAPSVSAGSYSVLSESDWFFTVEEDQTLVIIYGNSNRECNEPGADPYLWLYPADGYLEAQDDDGNHGAGQCVSSKIYTTLSAGDYRLRAGYYFQQRGIGYEGGVYELLFDLDLTGTTTTTTWVPTTTSSTTTTTSSTTTSSTTTTTSTTTTVPPTTSTSSTTTTVPPTTTTVAPTPTTSSTST